VAVEFVRPVTLCKPLNLTQRARMRLKRERFL